MLAGSTADLVNDEKNDNFRHARHFASNNLVYKLNEVEILGEFRQQINPRPQI